MLQSIEPPALLPRRFQIVRRLGEGGMGVVYEAIDRDRGDRLAVKTLRSRSADALSRFKREFRALQDVSHPNLVSLGELIAEGDEWCFTMELVGGEDFLTYVRAPDVRTPDAGLEAFARPIIDRATNRFSTPPPSHSAPSAPGRFDETKLRQSLGQLAQGLRALHGAGLVHRDVKPSNIRVTREGRAVLLDFGIVAALDSDRETQGAIGTVAYMAPEQALGGPVGTAADWYSVGVVLYEALTGRLPFAGASLFVLSQKQWREPVPPRDLVPGIAADLDALCLALLAVDPARRATGRDVLLVAGDAQVREVEGTTSSRTQGYGFVGREPELAVLKGAYADARAGTSASVLLQGESGLGKTCLVKHFLDAIAIENPGVVVLAGRCYERESVPFKAFDGVVDALTRTLTRMPLLEVEALLPRRVAPLVQIFPVLRRVEAIARLVGEPPGPMDPIELRARAFAAMRELLGRLGDRRTLLVVIDDIQWADDDSRALLADVLRAPEAPSLLLILTRRAAGGASLDGEPFSMALPVHLRRIDLKRLSDAEGEELAARLLQQTGSIVAPEAAASIAREASGHPLFIDVLVRHGRGDPERPVRFEDALLTRFDQLDELAQRTLDVLAVAGAPVAHDVLARAVGGASGELTKRLALLRVAHLAQSSRGPRGEVLDIYHDRIRVTLVARLDAGARTSLHERIAISLETTEGSDPEMLANHWRAAGDQERASRYTVIAADRARGALAFDRAARLYERALTLGDKSDEERRDLHARLGDALASVGRGASAAKAFLVAAEGARDADALDRRRRAAEQLLRAGHFDEGLATIRAVLATIGMQLPATPLVALLIFIIGRLFVRVRGLQFAERDATQIAAKDLVRIDVYWSVTSGLGLIDTTRAAAFQSRHLVLALKTGEAFRVSRALGVEIAFRARAGGKTWRATEALMKPAFDLAERTKRPDAVGLVAMSCGIAHYFGGCNLRKSLELLDRAAAVLGDCANVSWELATSQLFALNALSFLGDMKELTKRRQEHLRAAVERGDLYSRVNLRIGHPSTAWLAADRPDEARDDVDDAMRMWSKQGFHLEHFFAMVSTVNTEVYAGRGAVAHACVANQWGGLRRSLLLTVQSIRIVGCYARGRAAIAAALDAGAERGRLARTARHDARALDAEGWRWSVPIAALLHAGVAKVADGDEERARKHLARAADAFDALEMGLHAASARRALGGLLGGEAGRALVTTADDWMRANGVVDPARMTTMLVQGFR